LRHGASSTVRFGAVVQQSDRNDDFFRRRPQIHDSVSSAVEDLTGKSPTSLRDVITAARRDAASV